MQDAPPLVLQVQYEDCVVVAAMVPSTKVDRATATRQRPRRSLPLMSREPSSLEGLLVTPIFIYLGPLYWPFTCMLNITHELDD